MSKKSYGVIRCLHCNRRIFWFIFHPKKCPHCAAQIRLKEKKWRSPARTRNARTRSIRESNGIAGSSKGRTVAFEAAYAGSTPAPAALEEEMKVIEVTGPPYPRAHELPNKTGRPIAKHQKSPGGNSGSGKGKTSYVPKLGGKLLSELQKADQATTAANKRVLWLREGKLRLIPLTEYESYLKEEADATI